MPGWRDWVFALKTFAAAIIALYLAMLLDLPRPYWALGTVYITSQVLAGATRSKAFYRVCGTVLGAAVSVVLVPNLVNAPVLLSLAIAAWVGFCLYFSLLDRTPRSYLLMLAGYSAAIVGFPSVNAPEAIFDTAVARVQEITLGILCASAISTLVFPQSVLPLISDRLDGWIRSARGWVCDILERNSAATDTQAERLRLASDAIAFD
ncbi:MAG: FUSC family protein, partial [Rhodomicrobium sp.]